MDRHEEQTISSGDVVNVSVKAKDLKNLIDSKLDKIDLDQAI